MTQTQPTKYSNIPKFNKSIIEDNKKEKNEKYNYVSNDKFNNNSIY